MFLEAGKKVFGASDLPRNFATAPRPHRYHLLGDPPESSEPDSAPGLRDHKLVLRALRLPHERRHARAAGEGGL